MREWDTLVAGTLLGTERQAPTLPPPAGPLGEVLGALDAENPARQALSTAAALSLYRRAGWLPARDAAAPTPAAEADDLPVCSSAAAVRLDLMLRGTHRNVLPEWLALMAHAGRRVPPEYLPALLEHGRNQRELRPAILAVIGKRGRWLAAQNAAWDYSADQLAPEEWDTGSRDARVALLARMRAEDPEAARTRLEGTWTQETPDDRARFLALLATGLSMADEPFLEAALDDRRKEVRKTAADLLACLPESRFCARMVERVQPLVNLQRKLLGRAALELHLPEACNKAMLRDGIEAKPPQYSPLKLGEKAWWLLQMVASIPPQHWTLRFEKKPGELFEMARKTEWKELLWEGWAQAAARTGNAEWAEAILMVRRQADETLRDLVRALSPSRRDALVLQMLAGEEGLWKNHAALRVLAEHNDPWSRELSRAVVDGVRTRLRANARTHGNDWQLYSALPDYALRIPPSLLSEIEAGWPENSPSAEYWATSIQNFLAVLQFRGDMVQEISK